MNNKGTFALIDTSPHFGANSLVKLESLEVWTAQKTSALVTLALAASTIMLKSKCFKAVPNEFCWYKHFVKFNWNCDMHLEFSSSFHF